MRLVLSRTAAPPLRWCALDALPVPLREAVELRSLLEPVCHHGSAWWSHSVYGVCLWVAWVVSWGVFAGRFEALRPALVPAWIAASAAWLRWWADRPWAGPDERRGGGALLSTTTLVFVDRDAVAVVPCEFLCRRDGALWYGGVRVDGARHEGPWNDALDAAIQRARADLDACCDDPWRASIDSPRSHTLARLRARHAGRQALAACVAAALCVGARFAREVVARARRPTVVSTETAAETTLFSDAIDHLRADRAEVGVPFSEATGRFALYAPVHRGDSVLVARRRAWLDALCEARWGDPSREPDPRRAVKIALKRACLDPQEQLPLRVVALTCVRDGEREGCQGTREKGITLADEMEHFMRAQYRLMGGRTLHTRIERPDDTLIVRVERTHFVNVASLRRTSAENLLVPTIERAEVIDSTGRVLARIIAPRTVLRTVARPEW